MFLSKCVPMKILRKFGFSEFLFQIVHDQPCVVAHTSSPSYSTGWSRKITWSQEFETRLGNISHLKKEKKIYILYNILTCISFAVTNFQLALSIYIQTRAV